MHQKRDESNRISRLSSESAQAYLAEQKGPAYSQYRKNWAVCGREQIGLEYPLQLNVELTASCNLRCKMCYRNYDMDVRHGCLSIAEIRLLAAQFSELSIPSLWLSGGEPLFHPQIREILRIFSATNPLDFWMVTNGLLLTEELAREIIASKLTWLSISIDAASPDTYMKIRGGDYEKLLQNIDAFLRIRNEAGSVLPFLRVSFIRMPENCKEETAFKQQWAEKADIIDIQTLADYHDLDQFSEEDVLRSDYICTAPFTLISVLPNGDIIPCRNGFYGEKSCFNIRNITLRNYWKSSYHKAFAASVKQKKYCAECKKCIKSFLPHNNQKTTGRMCQENGHSGF